MKSFRAKSLVRRPVADSARRLCMRSDSGLWSILQVLALIALVVAVPVRAGASVITYSDLASFNAASNTTTIDFEGLAPADSFTFYSSPPGLTVNGVTFTSVNDDLFVVDPGFDPAFFWSSGQYLMDNTFEPDP